jgi:hypothetical protein
MLIARTTACSATAASDALMGYVVPMEILAQIVRCAMNETERASRGSPQRRSACAVLGVHQVVYSSA